jgi:hypothetical protein
MKHRLIIEFYSPRLPTYDVQLGAAAMLPLLLEELKGRTSPTWCASGSSTMPRARRGSRPAFRTTPRGWGPEIEP